MTTSYSVSVPDTGTSDSTPIRRTHKSHLVGKVSLHGCLTLYETFQRSVLLFPGKRCLGLRPIDTLNGSPGLFLFKSYQEIARSVKYVASGLVKEKLIAPNSVGMVTLGIFMKNSTSWVVAENAAYYLSAVTVPLYDTLGVDALEFIINQVGLTTIICTAKELKILALVAPKCPTLKAVVVADLSEPISVCAELMLSANLRAMSLHDLERIGEAYPTPSIPPQSSDIATLCYTSGTTGKPKGALVSHQNMVSVIAAGLEGVISADENDLYLSFLPLPHIFERVIVNCLLSSGAAIGFFRGDIQKIVEDLVALQPTIFCGVPRLYTRIHDKFSLRVASSSGIEGYILRHAMATKIKLLRQRGVTKHRLWDGLVFNKVKKALGMQNVRLMISGGAPLPVSTMEFFRVLLGGDCTCHEGYGQTETTGATSVTYPDDISIGHVGGPFPCCEIKLVDVPEMQYLHSDRLHDDHIPCVGRGEVWVRGAGVIRGYYKDEEETERSGLTTTGGWLKSGDIGMWTPRGQLAIIDRKKNMFKLSQGEYIAVEKVEGILSECPLVGQLFLHGDSTEDKLVAIVVPDEDAVKAWRASTPDSPQEDLETAVLQQMTETGRKGGLKGYELVYAVTLEQKPWTPESDLLTPTMKLKRVQLRNKYQTDIRSMYKGLQMGNKVVPTAPNSRL